jgi:DNA-directed RNA polymerase I subunit RPA49
MKHYVAVFDPASGSLDVTEAARMIVRPHVRQLQPDKDSEDEDDDAPVPQLSARAKLTEAFGTKKSRKAVQAIAENRLLANGGEDEEQMSQAMIDAIEGDDDDEGIADQHRINKPLPPVNTKATKADDAYPISTLVVPGPARTTLDSISFSYWTERLSKSKNVTSRSRFVSNRVEYLVQAYLQKPQTETKKQYVQLLRYIELLLVLHKHLASLPPNKRIPDTTKWPEKVLKSFPPASDTLVPGLVAHFFPEGTPRQRPMTFLRATILALTLHIPPPSLNPGENLLITEPTDVSLDLALEQKDATSLFKELGCKLKPATEIELTRWGLSKLGKARDENGKEIPLPKPRFARLSVPLDFPKVSQGRSPAKRR